MDENKIYKLTKQFREMIEFAKERRRFPDNSCFCHFPKRCCREASYILARYLYECGIETLYVWGSREDGQTHGWLVLKDDRVKMSTRRKEQYPKEIQNTLLDYGADVYTLENAVEKVYQEKDLRKGLIIDITADQFAIEPVYVGNIGKVHRAFEFRGVFCYEEIPKERLENIYKIILKQ